MVSAAKSKHFHARILESTSSKELFSTMNDLLDTTKTTPLSTVYSIQKLPQTFSDFFSTKIQSLRDRLDRSDSQPCPSDPLFAGAALSAFKPVSVSDVASALKKRNITSCSLDPIPSALFSACLIHLLPSITDIDNTSLTTAIVRPLLKKTPNLDSNDLKNFRPVSNLSLISKLVEKIALQQLNDHLVANNLLHPFQSAYRPDHNTETVLMHITNDLLCSSDSGKISLLTLLDLSAAFDTIAHSILLNRLRDTSASLLRSLLLQFLLLRPFPDCSH